MTFPTVSLQNALVLPQAAFVTHRKVEINVKISQQWPFHFLWSYFEKQRFCISFFFFFSNKGEITLHTYRKILGCQSSLTKRATVVNISPITAWSGCIWKTKLINKQIIHSQDLCLLACLNKWLVHLTYVKDQGAVLANPVLSFRHGCSQKHKSTTSAFHLIFFDCTDLVFLFS